MNGVVNHLWQSTLFAAAIAGLAWLCRNNRATVRHALWLSASVKFLLPFSVLVWAGSQAPLATQVPMPAAPPIPIFVEQIAQPAIVFSPARAATESFPWANTLYGLWLCGTLAVAALYLRKLHRVRAVVRSATLLSTESGVPIFFAPTTLEPGCYGILHPRILLPAGIEQRLSAEQLQAILAHELAHIRRRDNLTAALHMIVEAVFWFHPLVWWVGARLVEERERACDEEVLRLGSSPGAYAEGILNVCKLYTESPLACLPGVTGAGLKKRIQSIMREPALRSLSVTKKLALAALGAFVLTVPILVGVVHAPALRAQDARPSFEVASIKRSGNCGNGPLSAATSQNIPGRLLKQCMPVQSLILAAYVSFADGVRTSPLLPEPVPIERAPNWLDSELYDIQAQAGGNPTQSLMNGPMLQTLLEDRFQLKLHFETREIPVYALTAAKDGPKLKPFQEGSCTPLNVNTAGPRGEGQPPPCVTLFGPSRANRAIVALEQRATTLGQFAQFLGLALDRPAIDRTGIPGLFDFHLEFVPDQMTPRFLRNGLPPADPGSGAWITTAIQEQLGLKLEPAKGPGRFLVIDHVERPSEN